MKQINWGIIGCGDVTEVKSGPAFQKVPHSSLVAVMRRDATKAKDYAKRHGVSKWYTNAAELISDKEVNAIYIATPPAFHEPYAIAAIKAGKPVYIEKPMALNYASASRIAQYAEDKNIKLSVAHYRRGQPLFNKVKELITEKTIGEVRLAKMEYYKQPLEIGSLDVPKIAWRVNPDLSGGGLFHDLAPHQLDLMYWYFGDIAKASGFSAMQSGLYDADDIVSGNILFNSGVIFSGSWCFSVEKENEKDLCEIQGTQGMIRFPIFEHKQIEVIREGKTERITFEPLPHVQQPLIQKVVEYFLDNAPNPCPGSAGTTVMQLMDRFTMK